MIGEIPGEALSKVLPKIFAEGWEGNPEVKSMWSGIMAFTADGMPLVGRVSERISERKGDREWIAGGYNGHGMDKAWLTGEALVGMIVGRDVSGWFPSAYAITEERLEEMDCDNVIQMLGSAGS